MKKITLSLAALLTVFALQAQEVIWEDNFNDEDISDWTLYDEDGDELNWGDTFQITDSNTGEVVVPFSLISRSWQGGTILTPDNWAVSPIIDLTGVDSGDMVTLSWTRRVNPSFPAETYTVYVGMSNDIEVLENSEVTLTESFSTTPSEETDEPTTVTLDISEYAGAIAYIAIRHYDSVDADYISIDDLTITAEENASVADSHFTNFTHFTDANNNLHLNAQVPMSKVQLFNLLGQKISSRELSSSNETIDLNAFNAGVYLAQVEIEGQTKTFKFVKK